MEKLMNRLLNFKNPGSLPISFTVNEKVIHGIPEEFNPCIIKNKIDSNINQFVVSGEELDMGICLTIEIIQYNDFPVIEWTAWFTNKTKFTGRTSISNLYSIGGITMIRTGRV